MQKKVLRQYYSKGYSQDLNRKRNVMDKIWDGKSFDVGGHWPLWRGLKNRMTTQNRPFFFNKDNKICSWYTYN